MAQLLSVAPHLTNTKDYQGRLPLHLAIENGQGNIVTQLVEANPDLLNATVELDTTSALQFAAQRGQEKVFEQLLASQPQLIDQVDSDRLFCTVQPKKGTAIWWHEFWLSDPK